MLKHKKIIWNHSLWMIILCGIFLLCCKNEKPQDQVIQAFPISEPEQPLINFDYDTLLWTDIGLLDPTIHLDLKYATSDNFVKEKMYPCERCFLRPVVAKIILKAHQTLQKQELGIKLFDCYRPKPIQEKLWKKVPNASYVTPPWKGSMHNRGTAVDLTIVDKNGVELVMGSPYDFFGKEAHHTYTEHNSTIKKNRRLLKALMESLGLRPIRTEWWHYSYQKKSFEISDMQWACKED